MKIAASAGKKAKKAPNLNEDGAQEHLRASRGREPSENFYIGRSAENFSVR
jgi:hypothetical protein